MSSYRPSTSSGRPSTSAGGRNYDASQSSASASASSSSSSAPVFKLKRFLLRYYPPGIILESENKYDPSQTQQKTIDLLDLAVDSDPDEVVDLILNQESSIGPKRRDLLLGLVEKLIINLSQDRTPKFSLFKLLQAHILPLTNCGFNKSGNRFITGSYDRTCKVWDTDDGTEVLKLEGHKNVVYSMCVPEVDHRVLTDRGFLYLSEIEKILKLGGSLLYACYDIKSKSLVYRPGKIVVSKPPRHLVDFTSASTKPHWYGDACTQYGAIKSTVEANHLSIRVTPDHEMYVQVGRMNTGTPACPNVRKIDGVPRPFEKVPARELAPSYQCDCANKASCIHSHETVRFLLHAAQGLQPANVLSLKDTEADSPVVALGLKTDDQLNAFLQFYGYWLGDGSLLYLKANHRPYAVAVSTVKDVKYIKRLFGAMGLVQGEDWRVHSIANGCVKTFLLFNKRWVEYFDDEYWIKYPHGRLNRRGAPSLDSNSSSGESCAEDVPICMSNIDEENEDDSLLAVLEPDVKTVLAHETMKVEELLSRGITSPQSKSEKWFFRWAVTRLNRNQSRLVLEGLRIADGVSKQTKAQRDRSTASVLDEDESFAAVHSTYTSSVNFRDALLQIGMHAGYSVRFHLQQPRGSRCWKIVGTRKFVMGEQKKQMEEDGTRVEFKEVAANFDRWMVAFWPDQGHAHMKSADISFDGGKAYVREKRPTKKGATQDAAPIVSDAIGECPYDAKRDGRVWCVEVDHPDHLIVMQRAYKHGPGARGEVTKAAKPVIVGNCFNNPFGDKIATGSFDKTAKIWDSTTGKCLHSLQGHEKEIVCVAWNPQGDLLATGSTDHTARIWNVATGECIFVLDKHDAEIVSLHFTTEGDKLLTGSFDHTCRIWDIRTGACIRTLLGHEAEICSSSFNFTSDMIVSGSIDRTIKLFDVATGRCLNTIEVHTDEVLDVVFNSTGTTIATASADGTSCIIDVMTGELLHRLKGHTSEISKVVFNPKGTQVLTASADMTARLWSVETGECLQVLEGHTDEIFSCAFNYEGSTIITGSKDNCVRVWIAHSEANTKEK